jgi:type IV pilus assembly protein PilF
MRIAIVITLLALVACSSAQKKQQAKLHLRLGTSYLKGGNYPLALKEMLKAQELDPEDPLILNNLGLAYYVREEYEKAEVHLRKAIELEPSYSQARNNLGSLYLETQRYDLAIRELIKVTKDLLYESPEKALSNLALAYYKKGDFIQAKAQSLKAISSRRKFCQPHVIFGKSLLSLQDFKKAGEALDRAISICKNRSVEAHYYSGLSYYKAGEREKAVGRLVETTKLYPKTEFAKKAESLLEIIR